MVTATGLILVAVLFFVCGIFIIVPFIFLNEPTMKIMRRRLTQSQLELRETKKHFKKRKSESDDLRIQLHSQIKKIKANEKLHERLFNIIDTWEASR